MFQIRFGIHKEGKREEKGILKCQRFSSLGKEEIDYV